MTTRSRVTSLEVPGVLRRAAGVFGDLFLVVGIVLCVPFVIMAIGIPLALCVRLLFWVAGLL
jgi:hypothetical protein